MVIHKAFKFRLYPTPGQEQVLLQHFGACRFVYNHFLRQRIDFYAAHRGQKKQSLNYYDTTQSLTRLKRQPDHTWLKQVNAQSLQQALRHLDMAYNCFFHKRAEFPSFKSKRSKQSFSVPQSFRLDVKAGYLKIPKLTPLKIVCHRPTEGQIRSITISRTAAGRYFACLLCEVDLQPQRKCIGKAIGIDLGLRFFAVTSEGERITPPQFYRRAEQKLSRLQRRFSRKRVGSKGHEKARLKIARLHEKISNTRVDFLHKLSCRLVDESQAIYAESLNIAGMLARSTLAKSISDAGWSEFLRQIAYKSEWYGCYFKKIDRFAPSSKQHAKCGYIYRDLQLSEREWVCPACGQLVDRDQNAAQNILKFARVSIVESSGQLGTYE